MTITVCPYFQPLDADLAARYAEAGADAVAALLLPLDEDSRPHPARRPAAGPGTCRLALSRGFDSRRFVDAQDADGTFDAPSPSWRPAPSARTGCGSSSPSSTASARAHGRPTPCLAASAVAYLAHPVLGDVSDGPPTPSWADRRRRGPARRRRRAKLRSSMTLFARAAPTRNGSPGSSTVLRRVPDPRTLELLAGPKGSGRQRHATGISAYRRAPSLG